MSHDYLTRMYINYNQFLIHKFDISTYHKKSKHVFMKHIVLSDEVKMWDRISTIKTIQNYILDKLINNG